jgi:pimeloyl-ACP methyl ester carboxylesterase
VSVPRHLRLAESIRRARVAAASGELAALVATPPPDVTPLAPVLLVPGYTGSKEDFLHLLPLLAAAGHPATAIDLRGQYESGGPDDASAYTIDALAADIVSLVDGLHHVVGHSFGGLVCRAAVIAGAEARSLTLLASGPGALGGHRGGLVELMRPLLADGGVPAVWAAAQSSSPDDAGDGDVPAEVREFLQRRFLASPAGALLGMGQAVTTAADRVDELRATGVPTFVMYGTGDDAWSPAEQAVMAQRLGARHLALDGVSHSPAVDATEATATALLEFWAAVDGR